MRKIPEHYGQRLYDYDLAILFYLLQGSVLHIPYEVNKIPLEKLKRRFNTIERMINIFGKSERVFIRGTQNGIYKIRLIKGKEQRLTDYLDRYFELLVAGYLICETNVPQWRIAREEFKERVFKYNLNDFHTSTIEDMHLIFPELRELDYDLNIRILKDGEPECIIEGVSLGNFYRNFRFECSLDLNCFQKREQKFINMLNKVKPVKVSDMLKEMNLTEIKEEITKPQKQSKKTDASKDRFTKSDVKLLILIQERIRTGTDSVITLDDIEQIYSKKDDNESKTPLTTRVSNSISKLNARFKKKTGKKILELQEPYYVQINEMDLGYNGLDYEIIATLEDINIALRTSSDILE